MTNAAKVLAPSDDFEMPRVGRESKVRVVGAQIEALAHRLGPNAQLPKVQSLRAKLGVSLTTLDAALRDLEKRDVITRRQGAGVWVSPKLRKTVCLLCEPKWFQGASHSPFWDLLIERARERAQSGGEAFECHFAQSGAHHDGALHSGLSAALLQQRVQGVLAVGLDMSETARIEARGVPVVAFAGVARYTVALDSRAAICGSVAQLLKRGCKRVEVWTGHRGESTELCATLARAGTPLPRSRFRDAQSLSGRHGTLALSEAGFALARDAFAPDAKRPDGVLLTNDLMAHGALMALRQLRVCVGRDVQIATHANAGSPVLLGHDVPMLLMEVDPAEIVNAMFSTLELLMSGRAPEVAWTYVRPHLREIGTAQTLRTA